MTKDKYVMKINFKNIFNLISKEFYPSGYKCLICREELNSNTLYSFCDDCISKLPFNIGKICVKCGEPIGGMGEYCIHCKNVKPHFKKNVSVFLYKHPIDSLIRKFKFDNQKYLGDTLGNFIASEVVKMGVNFDVVIPAPMYHTRKKKRGYNQAELLCNPLKEKLGLNVDCEVLEKVRDTLNQAKLTRSERIENLENAFRVLNKSKVKGKTILIVDDVFTTGTTMNECSKTLLDAGAKEVYTITLAHANTKILF